MSGFGPRVGGGSITINSPAQLPLVMGSYDDFQITRDPITENIILVKCYRDLALLLTIELSYDLNDNLIRAREI